jgi:hypothetical protein
MNTFFPFEDSGLVFGKSYVGVVNDIVECAESTFPYNFTKACLSQFFKILPSKFIRIGLNFFKVENVLFILN